MRSQNRRFIWPTAAIAVASLACSLLPFGLGGQDNDSRIATLEAELKDARAEATAEAQADITAEPTPQTILYDDFESESDAFSLGENASVHEGALYLGPYEECANDVANFDQPVDCMVVCEACGGRLSDYHLKVNFAFEDGLSDREFGVILRLVDLNANGLLDREDYLLALGFDIFDNLWQVYLHEPDKIDPWDRVASGKAGFLQAGRMNELEVSVTQDGGLVEIRLNQRYLATLTGGKAEPGQHVVSPWFDSGAVGLIGLGRRVQARFDDFVLEAPE
jgi:hypothetical protein